LLFAAAASSSSPSSPYQIEMKEPMGAASRLVFAAAAASSLSSSPSSPYQMEMKEPIGVGVRACSYVMSEIGGRKDQGCKGRVDRLTATSASRFSAVTGMAAAEVARLRAAKKMVEKRMMAFWKLAMGWVRIGNEGLCWYFERQVARCSWIYGMSCLSGSYTRHAPLRVL
jgi:hypothetical protein